MNEPLLVDEYTTRLADIPIPTGQWYRPARCTMIETNVKLIDGWPWGWGADGVQRAPDKMKCPGCLKTLGYITVLVFGTWLICDECAEKRCKAIFTSCAIRVPTREEVERWMNQSAEL